MAEFFDLTRKVFGRLTVLSLYRRWSKTSPTTWLCQCECGKKTKVASSQLTCGKTKTCGNFSLHYSGQDSPTYRHGSPPLYSIWVNMLRRCENKKDKRYADYGGRGIKVCARWHDLDKFIADMNPRPSEIHSIDRINQNGNYKPSNCRWATPKEQQRNMRSNRIVIYNGIKMTLAEAIEKSGLSYAAICCRLVRGWNNKDAFSIPIKHKTLPEIVKAIQADERPQHVIAKEYGLTQSGVCRIKNRPSL